MSVCLCVTGAWQCKNVGMGGASVKVRKPFLGALQGYYLKLLNPNSSKPKSPNHNSSNRWTRRITTPRTDKLADWQLFEPNLTPFLTLQSMFPPHFNQKVIYCQPELTNPPTESQFYNELDSGSWDLTNLYSTTSHIPHFGPFWLGFWTFWCFFTNTGQRSVPWIEPWLSNP